MEENVQKSCWGVTLWTLAFVCVAISMVLLFNDVDGAQQTIVAAQ